MRRKRRFASRRALRRVLSAMHPRALQAAQYAGPEGLQVHCPLDYARKLDIERDLRRLGATFNPADSMFRVMIFVGDA